MRFEWNARKAVANLRKHGVLSNSMKPRACSLIPCLFGSMKNSLMAGTDQFSPVGAQNDGIVE